MDIDLECVELNRDKGDAAAAAADAELLALEYGVGDEEVGAGDIDR